MSGQQIVVSKGGIQVIPSGPVGPPGPEGPPGPPGSGTATVEEVIGLFDGTPDGTQFLKDDGTLAVPPGGVGASTIDELSDVTVTSGVAGDRLELSAFGWINQRPEIIPATRFGILPGNQIAADLQAAINALTAGNGGTIQFGPGVYEIGDAFCRLKDNVHLRGAGRGITILKAMDSFVGGNLRILDGASNIQISDLTIDGNIAGNPGTLAACIWLEGNNTEGVFENLELANTGGYGIGCQGDGNYERLLFQNIYIHNTGKDGIDFKNDLDGNRDIVFNGIFGESWGEVDTDAEALLDVRGHATITNVHGRNPSTHAGKIHNGIRFHVTDDEGNNGLGANGSVVSGFQFEGCHIGIQCLSTGTTIQGGRTDACNHAVLVGPDAHHNTVQSVKAFRGTGTEDFEIEGDDNDLINCHTLPTFDGATATVGKCGALIEGERTNIRGGSFSDNDDWGIIVAATAVGTFIGGDVRLHNNSDGKVSDLGTATAREARYLGLQQKGGADQSFTENTTFATLTGLTVDIPADSLVKVHYRIHYTAASTPGGAMKVRPDPGGTSSLFWEGFGNTVSTTSVSSLQIRQLKSAPDSQNFGGIAQDTVAEMIVMVDNIGGVATTLGMSGAQNASDVTPTVFHPTSYVESWVVG